MEEEQQQQWRAVALPASVQQTCETMAHQGQNVPAAWAERLTDSEGHTVVWFACEICHLDMLDAFRKDNPLEPPVTGSTPPTGMRFESP